MGENDDHQRNSDRVINQLRQEFLEHKAEENAWRAEQDLRWKHLDENWAHLVEATTKSAECQRQNTEAIGRLTEEFTKYVASNNDMVQTYRDFQGAKRIGGSFQKLFLWLLKWGVIGTGASAIVYAIANHFPPNSGPGA